MNTGAISSRYARALLKCVRQSGRGEQVCAQVRAILRDPEAVPSPLEEDLVNFIALLRDRSRLEYLRFILTSFLRMYCEEQGIVRAKLTTAVEAPQVAERVRGIIADQTGSRVELEEAVDPSLIGGFVLDVDDRRIDASVRRKLDDVRRELVNTTNRIV